MKRQKLSHVDNAAAVGRRLREARDKAGLSQRALAFPGCTPAYISRIEAGERIPSLQILREFARRLGVNEDYLATGAEKKSSDREEQLLAADVALRLDDTEVAETVYREVLDAAADDAERARALAGLGQLAFRRGDPKTAIEYLEEAVELQSERGEPDPANVDSLGRALAMTGEFEAAIGLFRRALTTAERRDDFADRVRFAVLLANALIDNGNFAQAGEVLGNILAVAGTSRDPIVRARLYWGQSRLHAHQRDSDAAARYARKALEMLELTENTYYSARAHQLLAHIELDRGNADEALALLEKGYPLIAESGSAVEQAMYRLEEARARVQLGELERGAELAMESSQVVSESSPMDAGRGYALVAEVHARRGDRARAIELYELAAECLSSVPNRYLIEVYSQLAELLEAEGRSGEALEILKNAVRVQAAAGRSLAGPS